MSYPRSRFDQQGVRIRARRVFVDRDDYLQDFSRVIEQLNLSGKVVVWNIYGVPGIGKSRLARELFQLASNRRKNRLAQCYLDFTVPTLRETDNALYYIRHLLPFRCNTFDIAFARNWMLFGRSMSALENKRAITGDNLLLEIVEYFKSAGDALVKEGGLIPGVELLTALAKFAGQKLRRWLSKHQELLKEMEALSPFDLRDHLAYYLGIDVRDAAKDGWTSIFVFDSFEKLADPSEYPGGRTVPALDQWVRDLFATSRRTAAVILSHQKLNWNQHASEAWSDSFLPSLLDRLDPRDVEEFLIQVPIQDRALRAHITNISDGNPFLIDLCLNVWESIVQSGRKPMPEDIGIDPKHINERFLAGRSLQESATTKALSFPDIIDATLFTFVVRELSTGYPAAEFDRFAELSFVKKLEGSSLFQLRHDMRKAVLDSLTPNERDRILDVLVRFCFNVPIKPDSDLSVVAITLGLQLLNERSEIGGWLYGTARDIIGAGYWPEIDRLLSDFRGRLDEDAERVTTLIRSLVLRRWGKIDEAIWAHHQGRLALIAPHSSFAEFHYANLLRIKGSYNEAERTYRRVSTEDATDHRTRLLAMKQLADLLMLKGSFRRSQAVLAGIVRDGIEPNEEAELLRQQGHIYRWNFLCKDAAGAYESALRIATAESLRSMTGRLETNLLELYTMCGAEPGDLLERALQTNEIIGAQLEIGKVRCARAIHFSTRDKDVDQARHELAAALRCFRGTGYRAGFAFVLMVRVLIDLHNDRRRAWKSLSRLVELTNSLGVYRFLARGLYDALGLPLQVLPAGRVFWLDPAHALASWERLVAGARA